MDEVPDTAQHFIECDTESCRNFSEFYCNTCHQRICDQCKQCHLEQNIGHEIVLYHERKRKLPSEKCSIHPTKDINIHCDVCQDPLCSTCFAQHHSDHDNSDLETIYNDILQLCQKEITEIWKTVIPDAKDNVKSIGEKMDNVNREIAKFRVSMKKRADELKEVVDSIINHNNKNLDEIENFVINDMVKQQKETEDYITYLEKMTSDYERKMSSINPTELISFHKDISLASLKMLNKAKSKLPIFTLGTLNKDEIAKQLGKIEIDLSGRFKLSSVTKVNEVTCRGHKTFHLSLLHPQKIWASDSLGYLIQYDMVGNILQKISTSMREKQGNHTVTKEGELLYTDIDKNTVYRVTSDMSINKLVETGSWVPGAIYSSPINGHILVGMGTKSDNKVTRYNREGRKLQDIQWDEEGQTLYQSVNFITENNNGDICTSDSRAKKVVVVTKLGEYRFSYSGNESQYRFCPYGICTDVLGHILVCNSHIWYNENCSSIHLLNINGQFLSLLLTSEQYPAYYFTLCIDNQHNFWVGGWNSSTVSVYKYLQNTKNNI
ncbi:uncharacterized protein LOC133180616 [Saccostrea echinata]|uniref:uncharacterized protein LOC133180616 n=1 Tax=Saccostrea echinata TaxID=191078 RepID=UPI002A800ED1|nr:uncharacterized protein LOC133180616 [Saccostrea echinata]